MRQFINAQEDAFTDLERRAVGRCIQFDHQELPPGCDPGQARIGFQVDPQTGKAILYVQRGIDYQGSNPSVRQWLADGQLMFPDFVSLRRWVQHDLAAVYKPDTPHQPHRTVAALSSDWGSREDFPPLVGREGIIEEAETTTQQQIARMAILLVGRHGVGKTAIVRELAWRWQEQSPGHIAFRVDLPMILAGSIYPAERGARLQQICQQVAQQSSSALLVMEDLHLACGSLGRAGKESLDALHQFNPIFEDPWTAAMIANWIQAGQRIVATTTPRGLRSLHNLGLRRRFHVIHVAEPSERELVVSILPKIAEYMNGRYGLEILPQTMSALVRQCGGGSGSQLGHALRLLDQTVVRARTQGSKLIGPDDVFPTPGE